MTELEINPNQFEGIYWNTDVYLPTKLGRFAVAGPDQWHGIIDFDGCMAKHDSWWVMHGLLSDDAKRFDESLGSLYYPLHRDDRMDDYEAASWWMCTLQNYISERQRGSSPISVEGITIAAERLVACDGLTQYLHSTDRLGVPNAIVSAGIGNVIAPFLEKYSIRPCSLVANWLEDRDGDGHIDAFDPARLVHMNNKHEHSLNDSAIAELRQSRRFAFLFGDGSKDPLMANGNAASTLSLRVGMRQDLTPEQRTDFIARSFNEGYDGVTVDGTFTPISPLLGGLAALGTIQNTI